VCVLYVYIEDLKNKVEKNLKDDPKCACLSYFFTHPGVKWPQSSHICRDSSYNGSTIWSFFLEVFLATTIAGCLTCLQQRLLMNPHLLHQ